MNLPPKLVELMLKSFGAPDSLVAAVVHFQEQGISSFAFKRASDDDPNWQKFGPQTEAPRDGVWLFGNGANNRLAIGIFMEGASDALIESVSNLGISADSL